MNLCRHCNLKNANRPMGLCWSCYYSPARALYTSTSKYARRGVRDSHASRPLPKKPTSATAGSSAKVAVLASRAARGEQLWHPDDCRAKVTCRRCGHHMKAREEVA